MLDFVQKFVACSQFLFKFMPSMQIDAFRAICALVLVVLCIGVKGDMYKHQTQRNQQDVAIDQRPLTRYLLWQKLHTQTIEICSLT